MKLRLHRNSIRFRLSQSEVVELNKQGVLSESISFDINPENQISYLLEQTQKENIYSTFQNNQLKVYIPEASIDHWANSVEQIGIYAELPLAEGHLLKVVIEKDFKCLIDRPGEEEGDLYPNPARSTNLGFISYFCPATYFAAVNCFFFLALRASK